MNYPYPTVKVTYPAGVWTGQTFTFVLSSTALDLTTVVSASILVIPDNQTLPTTWDVVVGDATPTSLTLTHVFGPNDTPPGILRIHAVLIDSAGTPWPTSEVSFILWSY